MRTSLLILALGCALHAQEMIQSVPTHPCAGGCSIGGPPGNAPCLFGEGPLQVGQSYCTATLSLPVIVLGADGFFSTNLLEESLNERLKKAQQRCEENQRCYLFSIEMNGKPIARIDLFGHWQQFGSDEDLARVLFAIYGDLFR